MSMGIGNNILELLSAATLDKVWRYLNCRAVGEVEMTPAASFSAREALSSPWAAIVYQIMYCHGQLLSYIILFTAI